MATLIRKPKYRVLVGFTDGTFLQQKIKPVKGLLVFSSGKYLTGKEIQEIAFVQLQDGKKIASPVFPFKNFFEEGEDENGEKKEIPPKVEVEILIEEYFDPNWVYDEEKLKRHAQINEHLKGLPELDSATREILLRQYPELVRG